MATDLLTWVCEKLTNNAPHAANGLADFVADRVLRRFVVLAELESITEADPEDVRLDTRQWPASWGSLGAGFSANRTRT